ncbi:MAG: SGNH/GDSL hydrolase family protein [Verrucomicrobiota bacterium]
MLIRFLFSSASVFLFPVFASAELPASAREHAILRGTYQNSQIRFEREKAGHVVVLGGSITENKSGHSQMVPEWLEKRFPDTNFQFTNAGISSTCSTSGAFRLRDHVLATGPVDLLIVEFAVNDDQDAGHALKEAVRGMEGIVQHTREHNPAADILIVHYVNPPILEKLSSGQTPVSVAAHESVAQRYELASVNVGAALAAGAMTWEAYGGTHPKKPGYRLASDMVISVLEKAWANPLTEDAKVIEFPTPIPLDTGSYSSGRFQDPAEADWMGGWTTGLTSRDLLPLGGIRERYTEWPITVAENAGAMMTMNFWGSAIGAFVLAGPDAAMLEVSVDAGDWKPVELYHHYSKGLNYPRTVMFFSDLSTGNHQLSLRVKERPEGQPGGERAAILKFVVNE